MKGIWKRGAAISLAMVLCAILFVGCTTVKDDDTASKKSNGKETVKLVYVNWAEGIAMTNLAKVILEEKMGYQVEMTMADVAPVFASLASGDKDVFMDAWLPVTHKSYMDKYGDDIEDLGVDFKGAKLGLVVPSYVDIDSISDLKGKADEFGSQIVGIDSGAGIMKLTDSAVKAYNLSDYQLISGSGPAMTAALSKAIQEKQPIVVTGWSPHWMFSRWDLKYLKDTKGIYGSSENIHVIARKGFSKDMPEVAEFLKSFSMSSKQLGSLMDDIANSKEDPDKVAEAWMEKNSDLVNSWLPSSVSK